MSSYRSNEQSVAPKLADDMERDAHPLGPTILPQAQGIRLRARDAPQGNGGGM
jgi:hypothetical protein